MKVKQVAAANKETSFVVVSAEKEEGYFFVEMYVEEEYPHKITRYALTKMHEVEE